MLLRQRFLGISLALTIPLVSVANEDEASLKKSLLAIQSQIHSLEQSLDISKNQERHQMAELEMLEKSIGEKSETQRHLSKALLANTQILTELNQTLQKQANLRLTQQHALSELMKATFKTQQQTPLKLLLTPSDAAPLARRHQYYRYFYDARAKQLQALQESLQALENTRLALEKEQQQHTALLQQFDQEKRQLADALQKRKVLLADLNTQRLADSQSLASLQQQERQIDQLCQTLQKHLNQPSLTSELALSFAKMKHQLSWPIRAKKIKTQGKNWRLSADEGEPVMAIYSGKVIFSEWLKGIGLLMIIDHGQGYMSLYGNNQKLYKSLGDSVEQGEMIARVGQSGGHYEGGLYFEIRKDGEPVDPSPWFKSA